MQYGALLNPVIEKAIARQMRGIATRLAWLLVRVAYDCGQTRSLVTNILGRQPGVTEPVLKTLLESSGRSAKGNIMRRTPQIASLIEAVEQWMVEDDGERKKNHMIKQMAIVKINYTKSRGAAKATIRYIAHRPGKDGRQAARPIYGIDGEVSKTDAYQMIDEAKRGAAFFRIVISPDPEKEDAFKDLYLWQITEQTILTLETRLQSQVSFIAVEHNDTRTTGTSTCWPVSGASSRPRISKRSAQPQPKRRFPSGRSAT
jgi:hypothetical protein